MRPMRAILVRVGVDQTYGGWNGPVDPSTNEFVYVPIPDDNEFNRGMATPYSLVQPAIARFSTTRECKSLIELPKGLQGRNMHLDPDFESLTYGDTKQRGRDIANLVPDDLIVFYAGLKPCRLSPERLIYAIIGLFRIDQVFRLGDFPRDLWAQNAHTRRLKRRFDDVIVTAKPRASGRLAACIPIGEWRNAAYRVRTALLDEWGGLSCKDGFIQRSAVPPRFNDPARFQRWFEEQNAVLLAANNPVSI